MSKRSWKAFPLRVRRTIVAVGGVAATLTVFGVSRWYCLNNVPLYSTGVGIPDAAQRGGPEEAMRRTERLLKLLQAANWDTKRVPHESQMLPDRMMAENNMWRTGRVPSYFYTFLDKTGPPEYGPMAFYTSLYVRQNMSYYRGDRATSKPTGFYIVAWRDGRVTQVPVQDARLIRSRNGHVVPVFPGMEGWTQNGFREAFVEASDDYRHDPKRREAFDQMIDCAGGCQKT